ncbi:hypothetical protein C440_01730 [Haloferax mucosum ATCC BAA-1512]|uniref:DUF2795 domain-containing protein n=1 Tax=Haloferax mucosum ATCC BAA-1512 TaxID=662479 RepID=M0IQC3_9EURY|nr:hypothetical protein [Haloferax mucosum]ELZ99036.1 hypothetical protein C440_01730 [Haloferax mucosum ATCC BAA-1512]
MQEEIKLSRLESVLDSLSYPVARRDAAAAFDGVTVLMADGNADLGEMIRQCLPDEFASATDLYYELNNVMPIEAVGEPGQSDGDA